MKRYFLFLAYNGKNYCGWQNQKNAISVQSVIEKHLSILLKEDIKVVGCGRTDTGVHAKKYVAHFDSTNIDSYVNVEELIYRMNNFFPDDIVVYDLKEVRKDANSRYDAIERTYEYHISGLKNPFKKDLCHYISPEKFKNIDVNLFNEACSILLKNDDFTSFSKVGTQTKNNICKIYEAQGFKDNHDFIFSITANRFLRNMVRAITGTLLDVAYKKINLEDFKKIIASKNRSDAGVSMPAQGLFLTEIIYPDDIFLYLCHINIK